VQIDGEPKQQVVDEGRFLVKVIDLRAVEDGEGEARAIADRETITPFDLSQPPLFRATIVRLSDRRCVFLLTLHHIIGDGWSRIVLYRELLELYAACKTGRPHRLKPLRIKYKDYAVWQNARSFAREESYWLERIADSPDGIPLPYDFPPLQTRDFRGDMEHIVLESEIVVALRSLARRKGTTLSNVVLSVFELSLYQWARSGDLCIGLAVANRSHSDLESLIGFFVNVLPIRCQLSDEMEFDDLLALVTERTYEAFEHQDYPLDVLIRKLNPARSANRQPLINVVYGFQNFADVHVGVLNPGDSTVRPTADPEKQVEWTMFDFTFGTSKFDMTLFASENDDLVQLTLEYDTGLFLKSTIRKQLETIRRFARTVALPASPSGGLTP